MSIRFQIIKYEIKANIFAKKWKYLLPIAIAFQNCIVGWHLSIETEAMFDYFGDFLKGMSAVPAGSRGDFLLPGGWTLFFVLLFYYHGRAARELTNGMGQQVLIRTEYAGQFWYAKCLGCICITCIWFLMAYLEIGLFYAAVPGRNGDIFNALEQLNKEQLYIQILLPVLAACGIGIWQLVISIYISSLMGLLGVYSCLVVSAYFVKWYLPGNYLMKIRIEEMVECGCRCSDMLIYLGILLVAGILTGKYLVEKMDYLALKSDM